VPKPIDRFAEFAEQRAPEIGWNAVVLHRELKKLGFAGSYQQVRRFLRPYRLKRQWSELATVRFETGPGEQAQVDYGQLLVFIGKQRETVQLFAGLLRVGTRGRHSAPPRFDPYYGGFGEVMVRDLQVYETVSQSHGGGDPR
jgi:hypothetical protein